MKAMENKTKSCNILYKKNENKDMQPTLYYLDEKRDLFFDELIQFLERGLKKIIIDVSDEQEVTSSDTEKLVNIIEKHKQCSFNFLVGRDRNSSLLFCLPLKENVEWRYRKKRSTLIPRESYVTFEENNKTHFPFKDLVDEFFCPDHTIGVPETFLILGEQGTSKTNCARMMAATQGAVEEGNRLLEITLTSSGPEGELALKLFGSKSGDYTDAKDRKGALSTIIENGEKQDKNVFVLIHEIQNMRPEECSILYTATNDYESYFFCKNTGKQICTKRVKWIFTSTCTISELCNRFGKPFVSRINGRIINTKTYKSLNTLTKYRLFEHLIVQEMKRKRVVKLNVCSRAVDYLIEQDYEFGNIRELAHEISITCFESENNVVNLEDVNNDFREDQAYLDTDSLLPEEMPQINKSFWDDLLIARERFSSDQLLEMAEFSYYLTLRGIQYADNSGQETIEDLFQFRNYILQEVSLVDFLDNYSEMLSDTHSVCELNIKNKESIYIDNFQKKGNLITVEGTTLKGTKKALNFKIGDTNSASITFFINSYTKETLNKKFRDYEKKFKNMDRAIRCHNNILFFHQDFSPIMNYDQFSKLQQEC
ncbi:sigma 54-interacting transcriptional regulator, partial [bacterium]|nr:sigma 54-interacting transcriptional regulator [bacterium]